MDLEDCESAEDVLQKVQSFGIGIESVTTALDNDLLTTNLMTTCDGKNLLQMASQARNISVLPAVVQAYKKAGLLQEALDARGGGPLPLHLAVSSPNYENSVLLLKESREHSPSTLTAVTESGATLLHLAAFRPEGFSVVKHLLREYRDICDPMLLARNNRGSTPLQIASSIKFSAEHELSHAESFGQRLAAGTNHSQSLKTRIIEQQTERPRRRLELARETVNLLNEPTMLARAAEAERQSMLREKQKSEEKEKILIEELKALLQENKWEVIISDYLLSQVKAIQKFSMEYLASEIGGLETSTELPPLTLELLQTLKKYIGMKEDDPVVKSSLILLAEFSKHKENVALIMDDDIGPFILRCLRSLQTDLQHISVSILHHLLHNNIHDGTSNLLDTWKQPLLLVKCFSTDNGVKRLAKETLEMLSASSDVPDPGTWSTTDVCFWMEGNTVLERRSEFIKTFRDAQITGLHLLELSSTEMAGLGVKFVSDQRTLSSLIDDLRRLNMHSVIGRKDVFLSYAHINVEFALRVKTALNEGGYSVWIDTAGIRAGQKWRTEIAHGIHDCRLIIFVMTPRATNSQYCHDELSLAEEYKKPIITVKYENSQEMDPGLKLLVQRRQWIDFSDESEFADNCSKLLTAITTLIGPGNGIDSEEQDGYEQRHGQRHSVKSSSPNEEDLPQKELISRGVQMTDEVRELIASEVEKATAGLRQSVISLETQIHHLMSRLAVIERGDVWHCSVGASSLQAPLLVGWLLIHKW